MMDSHSGNGVMSGLIFLILLCLVIGAVVYGMLTDSDGQADLERARADRARAEAEAYATRSQANTQALQSFFIQCMTALGAVIAVCLFGAALWWGITVLRDVRPARAAADPTTLLLLAVLMTQLREGEKEQLWRLVESELGDTSLLLEAENRAGYARR